MPSKTPLDIVFGCMTFGRSGEEQVRTSDLSECASILDTFQSHGHNEVDTSRFYGVRTHPHPPIPTAILTPRQDGSSEEYLAQLSWQKRGLVMDTKFFPNVTGFFGRAETHSNKADMQKSLTESLTALGAEGVDLWYLHAPDRTVPLEETARAVHELMKEGGGSRFKRWGVSNFMAWEGMFTPSHLHFPSFFFFLYRCDVNG
jgi:aflatoxin B1 aldehyde reductase